MTRIIRDKDLMKELFQGLAYYVFIAGALKILLPEIVLMNILSRIAYVFVFFMLSLLATCYVFFHVNTSLVQKFYPDFEPPILGNKYTGKDLKELRDKDLLLWLFLGFPYFFVGMDIIGSVSL